MSSRRKTAPKINSSKLYDPNALSLTLNSDLCHEKMWSEKVEEAKHIQEQKQIDRILTGVVKEKIFGKLLSPHSRISNSGFYALDQLSKKLINPIKLPSHSRVTPLPNQPDYSRVASRSVIHRRMDAGRKAQTIDYADLDRSEMTEKRKSYDGDSLNTTRRIGLPRQISVSKDPNLGNHFRELTSNFTAMIYDIKLTKQMLFRYNKQEQIVNQSCLEKFLFFFSFPHSCNFRQYTNWIDSCANCTPVESNFFVFQTLDESGNGFLSISDIFRSLQDFPSNQEHEKQIYEITELIKKVTAQLQQMDPQTRGIVKPTVEELLIRNHSLRIDDFRQLVKESSKELIAAKCVKATVYHQSMLALQHDAATREKNLQLQSEAQHNRKKADSGNIGMKQDGIRFRNFANHFDGDRSVIFKLIFRILRGEKYDF